MAIQLSEYIGLGQPYALLRANLGGAWNAIETLTGFTSYALLDANIQAVVVAPDSVWPIFEITGSTLTGLASDSRIVNRALAYVGHPAVVPIICTDPQTEVLKTTLTYAYQDLPYDPTGGAFQTYWLAGGDGIFSQPQRCVAQLWFEPPPYSVLQTKRNNWQGYKSTAFSGALQTLAKVPFFGRDKLTLSIVAPAGATLNIYGRKFQAATTGDQIPLLTGIVSPASGFVTFDMVGRRFDAIEVTGTNGAGDCEIYADVADAA